MTYMLADYLSAATAMVLFNLFRYHYIVEYVSYGSASNFLSDERVFLGNLLLPLFWLVLHFYSGYYNHPLRRSRLSELATTFIASVIGVFMIFFAVVLNDETETFADFYNLISIHLLLQFFLTYAFRLAITSRLTREINRRNVGFNTLIVGSGRCALQLAEEFASMKHSQGTRIVGFVAVETEESAVPAASLLSNIDGDLASVIKQHGVEELVVALDTTDKAVMFSVVNQLYQLYLPIRLLPNNYDLLMGGVRLDSIFGKPLVEITMHPIPDSYRNIKRTIDLTVSLFALLMLFPLLIVIGLLIVIEDGGAVIYRQERIGQKGKPFDILKFRTMICRAEGAIPQLSSADDPRITRIGKVLRRYRLDELPQFFNVLKGDMSLIGPRPERKYYIDRIAEIAPYYYLLLQIRPGITSWGMVMYGYADNVAKMVQRSHYDLIYIRNLTPLLDLKIMIHTIKTILKGSGV